MWCGDWAKMNGANPNANPATKDQSREQSQIRATAYMLIAASTLPSNIATLRPANTPKSRASQPKNASWNSSMIGQSFQFAPFGAPNSGTLFHTKGMNCPLAPAFSVANV